MEAKDTFLNIFLKSGPRIYKFSQEKVPRKSDSITVYLRIILPVLAKGLLDAHSKLEPRTRCVAHAWNLSTWESKAGDHKFKPNVAQLSNTMSQNNNFFKRPKDITQWGLAFNPPRKRRIWSWSTVTIAPNLISHASIYSIWALTSALLLITCVPGQHALMFMSCLFRIWKKHKSVSGL